MDNANSVSKRTKQRAFPETDLVTAYREFFSMTLADSDELRNEVYSLRYEVYCEELGWESVANHPDALEHDVYDECSRHCLLKHKGTGLYAGTVRMVLTGNSALEPKIPLIDHCRNTLYETTLDPRIQAPGTFGEISRLALRAEFRKRAGEHKNPEGHGTDLFEWTPTQRRRFPHIALGLYLGAAAIGIAEHSDGYAMMEPRLTRHLRYAGLHFEQVGEPIDFRGSRAPYHISHGNLLDQLAPPIRELITAIADDLGLCIGQTQ